jgi:hypothetical protein
MYHFKSRFINNRPDISRLEPYNARTDTKSLIKQGMHIVYFSKLTIHYKPVIDRQVEHSLCSLCSAYTPNT